MRIIGGDLRGRKLVSLKGVTIRPTSDRVREALFNILGNITADAVVLDLFAGSGALGLEALSRGAGKAVFVDKSAASLKVVERNIKLCRLHHDCRTIQWNILRNLNCLKTYPQTFNLVFLDPPYNRNMVSQALKHLVASRCVAPCAVVVAEHDPAEAIEVPDESWTLSDQRRYGQTLLSFFYQASCL